MKLWPWLTLAVAVIITRMSKETDASRPAAPAPGKKVARGIRNNNPGNIRIGINWLGRVIPGKDVSFVEFRTMPYGVRALASVSLLILVIITATANVSQGQSFIFLATVLPIGQ